MDRDTRIGLIRIVSYLGLVLSVAGFGMGMAVQHYTLMTVSFVAALVSLTSGLGAQILARALRQWQTAAVQIGSGIALAIAVMGFSVGISFQSPLIAAASFVVALVSVSAGFNAQTLLKLINWQRKRGLARTL